MCGRKYDAEEAQYERAVQDLNIDGPGRPRGRKKSRQKLLDLPPPSFDIRPTNEHVVIVRQGEGTTPEVMTWGYHPAWAKRTLINSRAEKLEGRDWGKAFRECPMRPKARQRRRTRFARRYRCSSGRPMAASGLTLW